MKINLPKLNTFFENHNITYAALFGSYAKGNPSNDSDVDILFDYDKNYKFSLFDQVGIQKKLELLIGKTVDFVPISGLKPEIKKEILNSAITIYGQK